MFHFPRWKIFLIFSVVLASIVFVCPNFLSDNMKSRLPSWIAGKSINLGLDLRGGSHLLLEVDIDAYLTDQYDMLKDMVRKELRARKFGYIGLTSSKTGIKFQLRDNVEIDNIKEAIKKISKNLNLVSNKKNISINFNSEHLNSLGNKLIDQSIEIVRRRVDATGTREPIIQRQGNKNILLQVPGLDNPDHLRQMLGQIAKMTFHFVNESVLSSDRSLIPSDSLLLPVDARINGGSDRMIAVYKKSVLSGDSLADAQVHIQDGNKSSVFFKFDSFGSKQFGEITKENVGKRLAIVLDGKVISDPVINEPIFGEGNISGHFTVKSATDLAILLRAGALPAPLNIIEERTVGPSLGSDSIESGKIASIVAILAVMSFMFISYGLFGIFANIALIINMFFILSILSIINATLTMPGIAAIILTMGMAVDANVLIFERIREEISLGMSPIASIDRGFSQAFVTILDSNLTTIIVAIILYIFGSGLIKGFAVTLSIGIISSMFSAITITKLMISIWVKTTKPKKINI